MIPPTANIPLCARPGRFQTPDCLLKISHRFSVCKFSHTNSSVHYVFEFSLHQLHGSSSKAPSCSLSGRFNCQILFGSLLLNFRFANLATPNAQYRLFWNFHSSAASCVLPGQFHSSNRFQSLLLHHRCANPPTLITQDRSYSTFLGRPHVSPSKRYLRPLLPVSMKGIFFDAF